MIAVRVLDRISRPAPIGIRFRDVATGGFVGDGLRVTVTSVRNPARRALLEANAKAVWYANRFPGFSDAALGGPDWEALQQPCLVEVDDAYGRFLPLRIVLDLPQRGLVDWPGWGDLPPDPLLPLANDDSPPAISPETLPLFSAPGRSLPAPLAEIRCQLERDDGGPAAWALLTASHGGTVRAIGQADAQGRAVLFFAYPERPRPSLATSPPAITDFRWSIELAAYWDGLDPAEPPEFAALMAQLDHPRTLFASTASPPEPLPSQLLSFGRGLVLRTESTPDGPSSSLLMAAS
ncbi:hypothetical protein RZN05_04930 [Sphingomonas sp. HF-S4]|uniref:Uncharacterized protein n=1 Tax=Sphingomonas agrestis TaxID=3080540 RepID=A0ABU3Y4I5_9SPHN|nr:hypothetical protein [Sphingomonas sp. HF-S4]MDV3456318.1 hypothetical protein [Sphingomonas sp. HF-S4]